MAQQVKGSGIVTAVALIIAVVWVWSLSLELLHAVGVAKKKKILRVPIMAQGVKKTT